MTALRPLATWAVPTRPSIAVPTDITYTDDIDWIAVERAVTGDRPLPALNFDERRAAALLLTRAGFSEKETGSLVGCNARQVSRWKFEVGLSGAKTCSLDDCDDQVKGRGLCYRHYRQDERRRKAAERKPRSGRQPARCGTRPGYKRHHREGTPICDACAHANRTYTNQRNQTLKEAA